MKRLLLPGVVALSFPAPAAAQDRDFTYDPFAARAGGRVSVAFTFRDAARGVRLTFAGREGRSSASPTRARRTRRSSPAAAGCAPAGPTGPRCAGARAATGAA